MNTITISDRAAGAVMGAFIGDAMGLGPHWYYDLDELRRDYGPFSWQYHPGRPKVNRERHPALTALRHCTTQTFETFSGRRMG